MNSSELDVFISSNPELDALLADNQTNLVELLEREGIRVRRKFAQDPAANAETGTKEPVSIIIASAALIAVLTPTIQKLISALTRKSVVVEEQVLIPVEDSRGNVIMDKDGQPILHWVTRTELIESKNKPQEETSTSISGPMKLEIKLKSSSKG
ncbi:MAG TPA: hypothetical protein VJ183_12170 [Chloroflexia bacterium]|nr:hypothetical protein [Chloroflexia bacterium]